MFSEPLTGFPATAVGPGTAPDTSLPLVVLLHGLGDNSTAMTDPAATWGSVAFDRTGLPPFYTDRGVQFFVPPPLPVSGFFLDPPATNLTSWQRALNNAGFTTLAYSQVGPLIADDVVQLNALAKAISANAKLSGMRVVFVAHSRGGLVVRPFLVAAATSADPTLRTFVSMVPALVTLHSPHFGSGVASLAVTVAGLLGRIGATLAALGLPVATLVASLTAMILTRARSELALSAPTVGIAAGEPVPGVAYHTFGGTSMTFARLWADVYTPQSYALVPVPFAPFFSLSTTPALVGSPLDARSFLPALGLLAAVPHVVELATAVGALVASTPELDGLQGDLLVTDASARLPFSATHTTNQLNHAEALWDPRLQAQVIAILSRLRAVPVAPPRPLAVARIVPFPASTLPAYHIVTATDTTTGQRITQGEVVVYAPNGTAVLRAPLGAPFRFGTIFFPQGMLTVVAELGSPYGSVPVPLS